MRWFLTVHGYFFSLVDPEEDGSQWHSKLDRSGGMSRSAEQIDLCINHAASPEFFRMPDCHAGISSGGVGLRLVPSGLFGVFKAG
ncbi:MAG: hypothetical protein H7839_11880 [Magnetococcus sp. YQC-5]